MDEYKEGSIFFCGDILLKRVKRDNIIGERLAERIQGCTIRCMNFEGPVISNKTYKVKKIGPSVFQNEESIRCLRNSGFNIAIIANNHIMDYGEQSLLHTCDELKRQGFDYTGAGFTKDEAFKPLYYQIGANKIGLLAIAECGFGARIYDRNVGYAWFGEIDIEERILRMKQECDTVIINVHAGAEEFDQPLPEIREKYRQLISFGADVIIGHHPHIVQGYERYKNGIIFYSLGNFAFDSIDNPDGEYNPDGLGLILSFNEDKSINFELVPTFYHGGVVDAAEDERFRERLKYIEDLNDVMQSPDEYENTVNAFCRKAYEQNYKVYYNEGVVGKYKGLIGFLKKMRRVFIRHIGFDDYFMFHNIAIETHSWIVKRASFFEMQEKW